MASPPTSTSAALPTDESTVPHDAAAAAQHRAWMAATADAALAMDTDTHADDAHAADALSNPNTAAYGAIVEAAAAAAQTAAVEALRTDPSYYEHHQHHHHHLHHASDAVDAPAPAPGASEAGHGLAPPPALDDGALQAAAIDTDSLSFGSTEHAGGGAGGGQDGRGMDAVPATNDPILLAAIAAAAATASAQEASASVSAAGHAHAPALPLPLPPAPFDPPPASSSPSSSRSRTTRAAKRARFSAKTSDGAPSSGQPWPSASGKGSGSAGAASGDEETPDEYEDGHGGAPSGSGSGGRNAYGAASGSRGASGGGMGNSSGSEQGMTAIEGTEQEQAEWRIAIDARISTMNKDSRHVSTTRKRFLGEGVRLSKPPAPCEACARNTLPCYLAPPHIKCCSCTLKGETCSFGLLRHSRKRKEVAERDNFLREARSEYVGKWRELMDKIVGEARARGAEDVASMVEQRMGTCIEEMAEELEAWVPKNPVAFVKPGKLNLSAG